MKGGDSVKPIIVLIIALIALGGGFYGGMQYQKSQRPNLANGQFFRQGQFGNRNNTGNRPVSGEIISSDSGSLTVKMPDGSSKIVMFSDKTEINKAAKGTKDDLKKGERIFVFGTTNADGSVTAQNIQLNPQGRMFERAQNNNPQK